MRRASARAAPPPVSRLSTALGAVLAVVAALVVFRGTLAYFFAQDDFTGLARARGIIPALQGPWRYLSGQLYFDEIAQIVSGGESSTAALRGSTEEHQF